MYFFVLNCFWFWLFQNVVSGTVTDDTGVPLPGATVLAIETGANTITDFDGNYSISAEVGTTLEFRFIDIPESPNFCYGIQFRCKFNAR